MNHSSSNIYSYFNSNSLLNRVIDENTYIFYSERILITKGYK